MPITIIANDIVEIRLFTVRGSQTAINVIHYFFGTVGGSPTLEAFVGILSAAVGPLLLPLMTDQAEYRGAGARVVEPTLTAEVFSKAGDGFGTEIDDPLPGQVSGLVSKRTAFPGASQRGRFYMPFPAEGHSAVDGTPEAAYLADLDTVAAFLFAPMTDASAPDTYTATPAIYHRATGTSTTISGYIVRDGWATQRRRGIFGASNMSPI